GMDLSLRAIREQVASAVDLIVHQSRLPGGSRKITHITEVLGLEGDVITLQDLFLFRQQGVDSRGGVQGEFASTGIRPRFLEKLKAAGIELAPEIFWHSQGGGN
ncbi:MAG TPA: CpaF family protein, partial [Firmicutes bacterium]|nr:CpaF family protein [Bacillota bacterium]